MRYIIEIGVLLFTVGILVYSIKTVKIASKSRLDVFLPILISRISPSKFKPETDFRVMFYLTNAGHGLALYPSVQLISGNGTKIAQAEHFDSLHGTYGPVDMMDHRVEKGDSQFAFKLNASDFDKLKNGVRFVVDYYDIFNRPVKTEYPLVLKKVDECYRLELQKCKIVIPK